MASIYTLATLRTTLSTEARLGADAIWNSVLNYLIEEELIGSIVRDKPREFLKTKKVLTLTSTEIVLPADFIIPERLEYTAGASGRVWELYDERKPVCPAIIDGKPASFKFTQDVATGLVPSLILFPNFDDSTDGDILVLDYYYKPNVSSDGDQIVHDRAIPAMKTSILQRLQIMQNKPFDQLAPIIQSLIMANRHDLSANDVATSTNTQDN